MTPVYITFTLYLILVLGIGFAAYFATRNFDDFCAGIRAHHGLFKLRRYG